MRSESRLSRYFQQGSTWMSIFKDLCGGPCKKFEGLHKRRTVSEPNCVPSGVPGDIPPSCYTRMRPNNDNSVGTFLGILVRNESVTARHTGKNGEDSKSVDCSMNEKTKLERRKKKRENRGTRTINKQRSGRQDYEAVTQGCARLLAAFPTNVTVWHFPLT